MSKDKNRTVMIVFQDTNEHNGNGFKVFLSGDIERLRHLENEDLSGAEYWGKQLFKVVSDIIQKAGVVRSTEPLFPQH